MKIERIMYIGPDSFNRPVFTSIDLPNKFFGSTEILVNDNESEQEILKKISEKDITEFGNHFDCEPLGTSPGDIKIVTRENAKKITNLGG